MIKFLWPLTYLIFFCSCRQMQHQPGDANLAFYDSIKHLTGTEFDQRLISNDSVHFFFYDNPDGDPKRYTRFYIDYGTRDSLVLKALEAGCQQRFERTEHVRPCRSEGKVYFFEKGIPKQTLYFSNRGDSCSHIYFIKDGWFYYMKMDSSVAQLIRDIRPFARKDPGDTNTGE